MSRDGTRLLFSIVLTSFVFSIGCSTTMKLRYGEPAVIASSKGEISVRIEDERAAHLGGDQPRRVGTIRNTLGMPFPLTADPGREPLWVVERLVSDCLEASGYRVVDESNGTPQVVAALQLFWSDGYQHSRMVLTLPLELRAAGSATPVWSHQLEANQGVTWTIGYAQMDSGYSLMLEEAKHKLIAAFKSSEFRARYRSLR